MKMFLEKLILIALPRSLELALTRLAFSTRLLGNPEKMEFSQSNLRYPPTLLQKKKFIDV